MIFDIYKIGKQYENKKVLSDAVINLCNNPSSNYIYNLYSSLPRHCGSVFERKRAMKDHWYSISCLFSVKCNTNLATFSKLRFNICYVSPVQVLKTNLFLLCCVRIVRPIV